MPLKKYNTTSALLASTSSSSSTFLTQQAYDNYSIETSPKISPTCNSSKQSHQSPPPQPPPTTTTTTSLSHTNKNLANQISSLSEILPNIIEAAAASGLNASSGSASATITPSSNKNVVANAAATSPSLDYSLNNYR